MSYGKTTHGQHNGLADREWLTTLEVMAALGLKNRSTLDQWARSGKGPTFYRIGATRRYDAADVASWLKAQRVEPTKA